MLIYLFLIYFSLFHFCLYFFFLIIFCFVFISLIFYLPCLILLLYCCSVFSMWGLSVALATNKKTSSLVHICVWRRCSDNTWRPPSCYIDYMGASKKLQWARKLSHVTKLTIFYPELLSHEWWWVNTLFTCFTQETGRQKTSFVVFQQAALHLRGGSPTMTRHNQCSPPHKLLLVVQLTAAGMMTTVILTNNVSSLRPVP